MSGHVGRSRRGWIVATTLTALVAVAGILWWRGRSETVRAFPLPELSPSPFLNTGSSARYVGSARCSECHKNRADSFRRTGMGTSMTEVDPELEPPDATFDHPASKRRYQIVRKDGKLWHRELMLQAEEIVLAEHPVKYVVGSGRHARTYIAEAEGFLVESPVTWYAGRKAWDMSPGYDRADHQGFERGIGEACLTCHAGHAEAVDRSQQRMRVHEAALSCERCHGPGSLHVTRHAEAKNASAEDIDTTIVNPRHLSRELAEAVCQQCHLNPAAATLVRGRAYADFRPGLPLQDFRHVYALEDNNQPMTVVGHVEQMHLSRCYTASTTLTCTTCHNPHAFPGADKREAFYQAICVKCHEPQSCKVAPERRQRESPANNCVHCHMPSAPIDVAHVAFTHHRIGIHDTKGAKAPAHVGAGTLKPFLDLDRLGPPDRKRSLGLAYLNLVKEEKRTSVADEYKRRAFELMSEAHDAGLPESMLEARLARTHFERNSALALPLAEKALKDVQLAGTDRCAALFVRAGEYLKRNDFEAARVALRELVTLRRHPDDWLLLADCEKALGNRAGAVEALATATRINPRLTNVHQFLANHYRQTGDAARADWHQKRAK